MSIRLLMKVSMAMWDNKTLFECVDVFCTLFLCHIPSFVLDPARYNFNKVASTTSFFPPTSLVEKAWGGLGSCSLTEQETSCWSLCKPFVKQTPCHKYEQNYYRNPNQTLITRHLQFIQNQIYLNRDHRRVSSW